MNKSSRGRQGQGRSRRKGSAEEELNQELKLYSGESYPRVALFFPASYRVASASLGFSMALRDLSACCRVDRFFLENGLFVSPDTRTSLSEYQIIFGSIAFEPDLLVLHQALASSGVPALKRDRGHLDPLLIAGGVGVTLSPVFAAALLDLAVAGEGDAPLGEEKSLMEHLASGSRKAQLEEGGFQRDGALEILLAGLKGCSLDTPLGDQGGILARSPGGSGMRKPIASAFISPASEFSSINLIEITRGCPGGCRFCFACHGYTPFRAAPAREIIAAINELPDQGVQGVGLVGAASCRHPQLKDIVLAARERNLRWTISSLSAEVVPELDPIVLSAQKSAALALETASPELRRAINKRGKVETLFRALPALAQAGIRELRLYVMIGIPGESRSDLDITGQVIEELSARFRELTGNGRTLVSVNPFIPKPGTPMAGEFMASRKYVKEAFSLLRSLAGRSAEFKLEPLELAYLQAGMAMLDEPWDLLAGKIGRREMEIIATGK